MPRFRTPFRLAVALTTFALVWAVAQAWYWKGYAGNWILLLGQQLGYQYANLSGQILMSRDGPFLGGPSWLNYAYHVVPELAVAGTCFGLAAAAYGLLGRVRTRPDGHTRCGRCAHILRGLTEPRCPECGQAI